jgi:hypothetical protein
MGPDIRCCFAFILLSFFQISFGQAAVVTAHYLFPGRLCDSRSVTFAKSIVRMTALELLSYTLVMVFSLGPTRAPVYLSTSYFLFF